MVANEAPNRSPEKQTKVPEIPKSREIFTGDINDAVIAVQQITGFEITPGWWLSEVGNDGTTEEILDKFDNAFEKFVREEMGIDRSELSEEDIVTEADAELDQFDERFTDDPGVAPLRLEFIHDLSEHLKTKYNLGDEYLDIGNDNVPEGDEVVAEQLESPSERPLSTKRRVKKVIEQLVVDSASDTEALDGIMVTDPERDKESLPKDYVEHKAERTAIAAAVINEATGSLVEELTKESDHQPVFEFKFMSRSDKPDKIEGLFDDIEVLFKSVGQQIDDEPGNLERVAGRYSQISENLKGTTFSQTIGETVSQGGPTIRTVFEDVAREVQSELSDRADSADKESKRQYALNALNSALKIKGFNLGHIQSVIDTPSKSLKEYIQKSPEGVTVEGLPPKPETDLFGETLGCPASLAKDGTSEFSMLDIYASSVVEALIERDII